MTETMSSNPCRICMGSKMNQTSIFINDLSRKVTEIADVEVQEGDGLPPTICEDCELDLEKCFKFREQIQWADSKFRESLSVSEVVFEECQIKQEVGPMHTFMNDDNQDQIEDDDDDRGPSDNDEDYEMREDPEDKTENAEKEGNQVTHPLDHVEIIERRTKQEIHIASTDQNSQEEPLIVAQNMKSENEPTSDPLMHTEPQSMETDNNVPGPSTSASTVLEKESSILSSERTMKTRPRQGKKTKMLKKRPVRRNKIKETPYTNKFKGRYSDLSSSSDDSSKSTSSICSKSKIKCTKRKPDPKTTTITEKERKLYQTHDDLTCFVCNITFLDKDELLQHLRGKRFFCRTCISEFDNHLNLSKHFTEHKGLKCITCKEIFFCRKDLVHHFKTNASCANHETKIQCEFCDKLCYGEQSLKLHVIKIHSVGEGKVECVVCKKKYFSETTLYDHLRVNHVAFEYLSCTVCNKLLDGPGKLKKHMKNTHLRNTENSKSICNICGKVLIDELRLRQHLKVHDQTETLCQHCGKTIKGGNYGMTFHLYKEHPKKPFQCQECSEQFDKLSKLRSHEGKVHKKSWNKKPDQPQCCEICGKKYKNSSTLKAHYVTHSDQRNFRCDICGATFKQKAALQTHSRIHNGFLPYFCEKCGESFRWKQVRDKHVNKCNGSQDKSSSNA